MYTHNANLKHMGHLPVNPFHDMDHALLSEMPFTWWISQVWTLVTEKSRKPSDLNFTLYYFKVSPSSNLPVTGHYTYSYNASCLLVVRIFSHALVKVDIHCAKELFLLREQLGGVVDLVTSVNLVPTSHQSQHIHLYIISSKPISWD
jgi:hypothetical protein